MQMVYDIEEKIKELPQIEVTTHHSLHAGVYSRTLYLSKGMVITGAFITIPTILTVYGDIEILFEDSWTRVKGFRVFECQANRKQAMFAFEESYVTMSFATTAKSLEEAEKEFTNDFDRLLSHNADANNIYTRRLK